MSWLSRVLVSLVCSLTSLACDADPGAEALGERSPQRLAEGASASAEVEPRAPGDVHLEPHRFELLELAFEAASAFPLVPHGKNRSRAQEAVVAAWLELDQPERALACIDAIADWRRGAGYADHAFALAQNGDSPQVQHSLGLAQEVAEGLGTEEGAQAWHRDRIRAGIARTYITLGQLQQAAPFERDLDPAEAGPIHAARARRLLAEELDGSLATLDTILATGGLEPVRAALDTTILLLDRFYADAEVRARLESMLTSGWSQLPAEIRIELLLAVARVALDHDDQPAALEWTLAAKGIVDASRWTPEDQVRLLADVAAVRWLSDERELALAQANSALAQYDAERERITDIDRADALRPLAEAYETMAERAQALRTYARALEEAVHNPNSRPRTDDLVAICVSMALHDVRPDDALWARIQAIRAGLGDPW